MFGSEAKEDGDINLKQLIHEQALAMRQTNLYPTRANEIFFY